MLLSAVLIVGISILMGFVINHFLSKFWYTCPVCSDTKKKLLDEFQKTQPAGHLPPDNTPFDLNSLDD